MLDALNSNFLLIGAFICLVLIVALSLYHPKSKKKDEEEKENYSKEDKPNEVIEHPAIVEPIKEPESEQIKEVELLHEEVTPAPLKKEEVEPTYFEDDNTYVYESVDFDTSDKKNDLDLLINTMADDLKKEPKSTEKFEDVQEKEAIISYQELKRAKEENRLNIYDDETEEYTFKKYNPVKEEKIEIEKPLQPISDEHKFKPSEIISPVSGRVEANLDYQKIPSFSKGTIKEEDTDKMFKEENYSKDEEFLQSLIDFRKNLN